MNITFRQGSEALSQKNIDRSEVKLTKLAKFITERNYEARVYVDVERESGATRSDSMWRASINLYLAGDRFNALEHASSAEKAVDLAIKDLKREVRTATSKQQRVARKSGGLLKSLRRGFG